MCGLLCWQWTKPPGPGLEEGRWTTIVVAAAGLLEIRSEQPNADAKKADGVS